MPQSVRAGTALAATVAARTRIRSESSMAVLAAHQRSRAMSDMKPMRQSETMKPVR